MLVNGSPREAISVQFDYEILPDGQIKQTQIDIDIRRPIFSPKTSNGRSGCMTTFTV